MMISKLKIEPYQIQQITEFCLKKRVNKHTFVSIKGILGKEASEKLLRKGGNSLAISITYEEEGEEQILFRGITQRLDMKMDGLLCEVEIEALSYTCLLDREYHFRTFQDHSQTFKELTKEVLSAYERTALICPEGEKNIGGMQVQYKETDWEFLQRMASQQNTGLVAECRLDKAAFFFGIRKGKKNLEIPAETCSVRDCMTDEGNYREYVLETGVLAEIGDEVIYQEKRLVIFAVDMVLVRQEIRYLYRLRAMAKCKKPPYENRKLAGLSLKGHVVEVSREKVRVEIEDDEGKRTRRQWFDYATVYSSSSGSGWYCMPEEGDEIRLYFPDEEAGHAYVLNAVHMEGSDERKNPACKYIRTNRNQEIRMTPEQILITNHSGESVILDEKGIKIESGKDIVLKAGKSIELSCDGTAAVEGRSAVVLKQGSNMIALRNGIREHGLRIERQ